MIQIDIFWSFAFGAMFAAFAYNTLSEHYKSLRSKEKVKTRLKYEEIFVNRIFFDLLIFMSFLFIPSGVYLLWAFPTWESMLLLKDKDTTHAIIPTLFTFSNAFMATLGFYVTARKIEKTPPNESEKVHFYWITAYTIFTAILGMGYNRFIFIGTYDDWISGKTNTLAEFFQSEVFNTLLAMATFFVPTAYTLLSGYLRDTYGAFGQGYKSKLQTYILKQLVGQYLFVSAGWVVYMFGLLDQTQRNYYDDGTWTGMYGPLVWFTGAHGAVFFLWILLTSISVPSLSYANRSRKALVD